MTYEPYYITVKDAANYLAMHKNQVYELCYTGAIESIKIGKARRVVFESLKFYAESLREQARQERENGQGQAR
jgi:excisionase family DNA binding protein